MRLLLLAAASALALSSGIALAQEQPAPVPSVPEQPADPAPEHTAEEEPKLLVVEATERVPDPPIPQVWAPVPTDRTGASAYGLYLASRGAQASGDLSGMAALLAQTQALVPEQPMVAEAAYVTALFNGDLVTAARLAPAEGPVDPFLSEAGRFAAIVEQFGRRDARGAWRTLSGATFSSPVVLPALYIRPHLAAAANDRDQVRAETQASQGGFSLYPLSRAAALERIGDRLGAEADYQAVLRTPIGEAVGQLPYGAFLERTGRRDEALAVYDAALAKSPNDDGLKAARARAAARGRPPALPTPQAAAAEAIRLMTVELQLYAAQSGQGEAINQFRRLFLRYALALDAQNQQARLELAQLLGQGELEAEARALLSAIPAKDPAYAAARQEIAFSLAREDKNAEALAELQRLAAARPDDALIKINVLTQLLAMDRHRESLSLLDDPVLAPMQGQFIGHYLKGLALEGLEQWPEAEAELTKALELQPDNAELLNNLGYLLINQGKVDQGAEMVAKAFAATPDSGHVQDSLGWAQFKQGRFDEAVATLEEAVVKEPASAEINDHLGDAYWMAGRKREAHFRWTRVLTLDPSPEQKLSVERKLSGGL